MSNAYSEHGTPLLGIDTVGNLLRILAGQNTRKKQFQFLRQLKLSLYEAIQVHALQYLQSRVSSQLLPGGVSWAWLTHLATVPKLAVNGVARFAVLRWAVNEDDDECLRLRLQARYRLSNHANSVGFPPDCTHSDLILLPLVKNAVMTMVSTLLPCTAALGSFLHCACPGCQHLLTYSHSS